MEMEDDQRNAVLQMDSRQMYDPFHHYTSPHSLKHLIRRRDVATFVNSYPTLDVNFELSKGEYTAGAPVTLQVSLARDIDDEDAEADATVVAPFYPSSKLANWWLVIGAPRTRALLAIKRVTVARRLGVKLEFTLPKGEHELRLYVICDSYVGADHDVEIGTVQVAEGEDSDESEDEGEDEDEDEGGSGSAMEE